MIIGEFIKLLAKKHIVGKVYIGEVQRRLGGNLGGSMIG